MTLSRENFQKARRISRAIQEYLEDTNYVEARSTDVYAYLARRGLIEKDRHQGIHFRRFLHRLKDEGLLQQLIPQCSYEHTKGNTVEWRFFKASPKLDTNQLSKKEAKTLITPKLSENEINELIAQAKPHVDKLPKIDSSNLTPQQQTTRKNYKRAYELWTDREIEIMTRAYKKFENIEKVALLLDRQPSVVRKKIEEHS